MLGSKIKRGLSEGAPVAERLRLVSNRGGSGGGDTPPQIQPGPQSQPGDRIRRGTLSEPPPALSADVVERRLAEEIDYARRLLVAMGERLANDPTVIARHGATLQGFDVVAQMLGHLGGVVGAEDRDAAIDRIGMADLRGRIRRRSIVDDGIVRLT